MMTRNGCSTFARTEAVAPSATASADPGAPHRDGRPVIAIEAPATGRAITGKRAQVGAQDGVDASVLRARHLVLAMPDAQHPCHPAGVHGLALCGCQCRLVPLPCGYYILD
jgi:hypothetical protein